MTNIIYRDTVPTVFVYLSSTATGVTGNGTAYTILFNSNVTGYTSPGYNTGTGIYTVPLTGNYLICTSFQLTNIINGANGNLSVISTTVQAHRLSELSCNAAKDASNIFCTNGMIVENLTAGNSVSAVAQLNNGSAASVNVAGGSSPFVSWLYIRYLG